MRHHPWDTSQSPNARINPLPDVTIQATRNIAIMLVSARFWHRNFISTKEFTRSLDRR
jgi:hypothetical protein